MVAGLEEVQRILPGGVPVGAEPGLRRAGRGREEHLLFPAQLDVLGPGRLGARLEPERALVRAAEHERAVAGRAGDARSKVGVVPLRKRQHGRTAQGEVREGEDGARPRLVRKRQPVGIERIVDVAQLHVEAKRPRIGVDTPLLAIGHADAAGTHVRGPARIDDGLRQLVAGRVELADPDAPTPRHRRAARRVELELDGLSGEAVRHGHRAGGHRGAERVLRQHDAVRLRRDGDAARDLPARGVKAPRERVVARGGIGRGGRCGNGAAHEGGGARGHGEAERDGIPHAARKLHDGQVPRAVRQRGRHGETAARRRRRDARELDRVHVHLIRHVRRVRAVPLQRKGRADRHGRRADRRANADLPSHENLLSGK